MENPAHETSDTLEASQVQHIWGEMPVAYAQSCDTSFGTFTFRAFIGYIFRLVSRPKTRGPGKIALIQLIKPMSLHQPHQAERMTTKGWLVVRRLRSPP
jgi:hypothetical protein